MKTLIATLSQPSLVTAESRRRLAATERHRSAGTGSAPRLQAIDLVPLCCCVLLAAPLPAAAVPPLNPPVVVQSSAVPSRIAASPAALPEGSFRQSRFFEVASADPRSTAFVAALTQNFEAALVCFFPGVLPEATGPRNIRIELLSAKNAPWTESCRIVEKSGQWLLLMRWTRDLELKAVNRALARALLGKLVQNHSGTAAQPAAKPDAANGAPGSTQTAAISAPPALRLFAPAVPDWLLEALLSEVQLLATPAVIGQWVLDARETGPAPLEALTTTPHVRQGFWFGRHLQRELIRQKIPASVFFAGLGAGGSPEEILVRHFPDIAADPDCRALWWPTGFVQITRPYHGGPVLTMRESREYLESAMAFVFAPAGVDRRFSPEDLPSLRGLPAVQSEIRSRIQRLKRDITSANPVWHNPWLSYGVYLEKLLDTKLVDVKQGGWRYGVSQEKSPAPKSGELQTLRAQLQADIAAARSLEDAVEAVFSSLPKKK